MTLRSHPPPRILHLITRLDRGGSTTNTLASVRLQRNRDFATALAYGVTAPPHEAAARALRDEGVPCFFVPGLVRDPAPGKDAAALLALVRLLRRERFDLVHTHTSKAGVLGRLAARLCRVPAVHTAHGHVFYGYFGPLQTRLFVFIERAMARCAARLISLTDAETRDSLARRIGRPGQYVTIPSGVPLARFRNLPSGSGAAFRARWGIPPGALLIVSVGRLTPVKGFDRLIPAFARARFPDPPAHLAVIGDGEERAALERLAEACGARDRVAFAGDCDDVRPALAAADVFALASRNEGMGRAIVEAMAAGLPAVAPDVGGVREVIRHGDSGLLLPPDDEAALAAALEALASDPARRRDMGRRAAEWVFPRFDEQTMVASLAALYREVLARPPAGGGAP